MRVRIYNNEGKLIFQQNDINGTIFDCDVVRSSKNGNVSRVHLKVWEKRKWNKQVERHYQIFGRDLIVVLMDEVPKKQS